MPEWLTWQTAGKRLGLSPDAARMRARRLGWRTQPGNDGKTLVMVPDDADVRTRQRAPKGTGEHSTERAPEHAASLARLTELLATADARAERADSRADRAEQRAEQAEQRADAATARADAAEAERRAAQARADASASRAQRAEDRASGLRDRLDAMEGEFAAAAAAADQALTEASAAAQTVEALRQADDARRAADFLTRLRAAWRRE